MKKINQYIIEMSNMGKINHNGWTVLFLGKDLIVYKNGEQRTYKIKEKNGGLEHKEGEDYFYIRTEKGFYYQFKFEENNFLVGDKFKDNNEHIGEYASHVFEEV